MKRKKRASIMRKKIEKKRIDKKKTDGKNERKNVKVKKELTKRSSIFFYVVFISDVLGLLG
jgi:hypothetical protein